MMSRGTLRSLVAALSTAPSVPQHPPAPPAPGADSGSAARPGEGLLRLRFWGVRGSVPAPGAETARYGGNTACVTLEWPGATAKTQPGAEPVAESVAASTLFILDAGTGIRILGLELLRLKRLPLRAHLFLSHSHWDHIQGFPFFAPAFVPGNNIVVHGAGGTDAELAHVLSGQMLHRYFPVSLSELGAQITFQHIATGEHHIADARVRVASLHHPGGAAGYRFEVGGRTIAYCTDTEPIDAPGAQTGAAAGSATGHTAARQPLDPRVVDLARGADVLIHDAQYTDAEYPSKVGWGHSTASFAVRTALAAGVARLVLFHHDPMHDDVQLDAILAEARALAAREAAASGAPLCIVDAAREGMEIALPLERAVLATS
jgi:phosphoribosyl 1,2-cyclic phosphodiesterase